MAEIRCSSQATPITNCKGSTRFMCPNCGQTEIIRSPQARQLGTKYTCSACGFVGPN